VICSCGADTPFGKLRAGSVRLFLTLIVGLKSFASPVGEIKFQELRIKSNTNSGGQSLP
jgi:hypothetical protein